MFFQFAGLLGVIVGLKEARKIFDRPSFFSTISAWLRGFVGIFRKPISAHANIQLEAVTAIATAGSVRIAVSESLPDKVSRIERELGDLRRQVDEGFNKRDREVQILVESERNVRTRDIGQTNQKMETAMIGGINLELGGSLFLFLGVLLTSVPEEFAILLKRILPL
jgi:hypothetical protein